MNLLDAASPFVIQRVCETYAHFLAHRDLSVLTGWTTAEWEVAPQIAFVLGVGPLLQLALQSQDDAPALPDSFRAALARQYDLNRQRVARLKQDKAQLATVLDAHAVPFLTLKGILLLERYYPDAAARPLADLDVLVHPADLACVSEALASLGYVMEAQGAKPNFVRPDNRFPICFDGEHPDNPRRVEVHTALQDEFRGTTIDRTEWAWRTCVTADVPELALPVLFAHLLSHTSRDIMTCRVRLIQLYDIALIARTLTKRTAWDELPPPSDAAAARFLYPALALTCRYFPADIPAAWYQTLSQKTPAHLRAWCERQTLFDVSWLGGNHLGVLQTVLLWACSPRDVVTLGRVMWARRQLHLKHRFPQLAGSPLAYPAYVWDRVRGGSGGKKRRGRWDFSGPAGESENPDRK